jgi:hypothetical protein
MAEAHARANLVKHVALAPEYVDAIVSDAGIVPVGPRAA